MDHIILHQYTVLYTVLELPFTDMHHIVTDKEPVLISICIQFMTSLFILIDVICYCLHTKSVIMKGKSEIYIS